MILDYPAIREEELFYIYILRYHRYCGRAYLKDSFEDFYEHRNNIENVLFPKKLEGCLSDLRMSSEEYIEKHSVLPYYRLFLTKERYEEAVRLMLRTEQPYVSKLYKDSKIRRMRDCIYYCPVCHRLSSGTYEDIKIYHQFPEVFVCKEHRCYLNCIPVRPVRDVLKPEDWDETIKECNDEMLLGIATDISYIISSNIQMDGISFRKRLRKRIMNLHVYDRFENWDAEFEKKLSEQYCELPEEYRYLDQTYSFDKFVTERKHPTVAPIEYLVFIRLVFGSFRDFMEI